MAALGGNPEDPPAEKVEKEAKEEPAPQEKPAPAPETKEEKKAEKKKADTETVTIRATGTPGTAFSGNYLVGGSQRSVDGVTPQDFEVEV